jgi:rfaE bifunctional protein kinase chain/domain
MTPERLQEILDRFPSRRIAVVGDFFLDKYLDLDPALAEVSIETGKRANQVVGIRCSPGAAGTVVNNLASLDAGRIHTLGAIGDDGEGYELTRELKRRGCDTAGLLQFETRMTPTYLKPREITDPGLAGEHERCDTKNRTPTPAEIVKQVVAALDAALLQVEAVVIADQVEEEDCGVITAAVRDVLADRAKSFPKIIFLADSRRRIREFRNVIIKPNQFEAVGFESPGPNDKVDKGELESAVRRLRKEINAPMIATRSEHGVLVSDPELTYVPAVKVNGPIDPTGAGDSVTAGVILALASGATLAEAALVGMLVASITVQQLATTGTAKRNQVLERLKLWREQHAT